MCRVYFVLGVLLSLLAATLVLTADAGDAERSVTQVKHPDIILISLDTLRMDRLGCYGKEPSVTPHLDRFAAGATRFARAWATAPWTLPSHVSMFTGQYSFEHGAHTVALDEIEKGRTVGENNVLSLSPAAITLAERLRAAGYRTGSLATNEGYLTRRYGLDQGFETFHTRRVDGLDLNQKAEAWVREADERPLFLFLNYMDAHRPYNLTPHEGCVQPASPLEGVELLKALYPKVLAGKRPEAQLRRLTALYDLAVANLDEAMGDLFTRLRALGRFDGAVIVVVSDHGEYLGEHDLIEHSKDVHEPVLRIPFLVKAPHQRQGRVVHEATSLVHVPFLIAQWTDALAADSFPYSWPAESILAENHYTRIKDLRSPWSGRFQRIRHVVVDWPFKYIRSSDGAHRLFNLDIDPAEHRDLLAERTPAATRLRDLLEGSLSNPQATFEQMNQRMQAPAELSDEEIKRLRALGYL